LTKPASRAAAVAVGCFACTLTVHGLGGVAYADEPSDLQGLLSETYVKGASKTTESNATAPAVSTTLTSDDIRRYGIHSLDEAINFLSLGAFTSSSIGTLDIGSNGVLIPGDQGSHFLLLINGHAMNEALYGAARFDRGAGIPMELVDHIEVILGPGSVLYGSSAMLGVINVVTKEARDFSGLHLVGESELLTSYRIAGGAGYEFALLGQPAKLAFELEYYTQSGPSFSVGPQKYGLDQFTNTNTSFGQTPATGIWGGGSLKNDNYASVPSGLLTFRLGDLEVDLHASIYKRASPFNADIVYPEADFDDSNNYRLDRSIFGDIKHRLVLSAIAELRSRLYADSFETHRYTDVSDTGASCLFAEPCRLSQYGASRWVGLEEQANFDWFKDSTFVTLVGVDGRLRWMLAQDDTFDKATGVPLASSQGALRANDAVFAAYGQQTWQPAPWLGLNAGARFDYDQRFGDHVSPRAAVNVNTWTGGTFKAIYADAFRAPSWEESSVSFDDQIPATNLRPETVQSVEGVVDQRLGTHRFLVGVFRSRWTDMVELQQLTASELAQAQSQHLVSLAESSAYQYQNVASIDSFGFNSGYEGSFLQSSLRLALNVTGAYSHRNDPEAGQQPLALVPQVFGNARIAYTLPGDLPTLAVTGRLLAQRLVDQYANFPKAPYAPALPEIRATVSGPVPWIRGLSYRASADWALVGTGPYVIGPFQTSFPPTSGGNHVVYPSSPALNPIDTFRATVGLQMDF
jgi:outer membrane receptor protein involved in Fe transport